MILTRDICTNILFCFTGDDFFFNCFYRFSPSLVIGVLELINLNLHLPRDFQTFFLLMTPEKMPKHPSNPAKTSLFYLSFLASIVVSLKRKINSSLTKRQTMCNFFRGWTWVFLNIKHFLRVGVFVFIANDNDVLFSLCVHRSWWIFIRPILDVRVRKSRFRCEIIF